MISQTTATGSTPASRHRSTEASVCPARTSTPPGFARSGKMCPGRVRSSGVEVGSASTRMVRARSAAEIPVVTPVAASTLIVKAVLRGAVLRSVMSGRLSRSARSSVIGTQTRPRASATVKFTSSVVAN